MKLFIFLVCQPCGRADFSEIKAATPADAVRAIAAAHPGCRFNIVNVATP